MKQFIFTIIIIFGAIANAEETTMQTAGKLQIVPEIGATYFKLTSGGSSVAGYAATVKGSYGLELLNSNIEFGLGYMEAGTKTASLGIFGDIETKLGYLILPSNWAVPMFNAAGGTFYGNLGMTPAFLLSAKSEGTGFLSGSSTNVKDSMNTFDVLARAGVQWQTSVTDTMGLSISLDFMRGLLKAEKDGSGHNQGFAANVGLLMLL